MKGGKIEKKKPIRRYQRAGLLLHTHAIRRELKERMNGRRFQKEVEIVITACLQHCLERLLISAAEKITKGSYIDVKHLHAAINEEGSELANLFPKHVAGIKL